MSQTTFLITGAARGIGFQTVSVLLQRPSTTVIAAVRELTNATKRSLATLPKSESSSLLIVKIDVSDPDDASKVVTELQDQGINRLDVVIASAGMATSLETVLDTKPKDMTTHFEVNTVGQLKLFQACYPLMKKRGSEDKEAVFCVITSSIGSIAAMEPVKCLAYGTSKAALNFLTRKIHFELQDITSFALHPGWVQTDMGAFAAKSWGAEQAPMTVEESADAVIRLVDGATRGETSGRFLSYDGSEIPW